MLFSSEVICKLNYNPNLRKESAAGITLGSCQVVSDSLWPHRLACQVPLSLEFPRQEYWSGLPFPTPGDFPDRGIEPTSPALAGTLFYCWATREATGIIRFLHKSLVFIHLLSHVQLFVNPWTVACQAPLSLEFPRQEYWSGLLFSAPGDLPHPGIESRSLASPAQQWIFYH